MSLKNWGYIILFTLQAIFLIGYAGQVAYAQEATSTPVPPSPSPSSTLQIVNTPTPGSPFNYASPTSEFVCPSSVPVGYGTVTPDLLWLSACGQCLPSPTATGTPDPNALAAYATSLVSGSSTPEPTVFGATSTPILGTVSPTVLPTSTPWGVTAQLNFASNTSASTVYCDVQSATGDFPINWTGAGEEHILIDLPAAVDCYGTVIGQGWWSYSYVQIMMNEIPLYEGIINTVEWNLVTPNQGCSGSTASVGSAQTTYGGNPWLDTPWLAVGDPNPGPCSGNGRYVFSVGRGYIAPPTPVVGVSYCSVISDGSNVDMSLPEVFTVDPIPNCLNLREWAAERMFEYLGLIRWEVEQGSTSLYDALRLGWYDLNQAVLFYFLGWVPNKQVCFYGVDFAVFIVLGARIDLPFLASLLVFGFCFNLLIRR